MNLSFPRIWEQDECRSSVPIGIGALDVKLSYLDWRTMHIRQKPSLTRQFRKHNGQIAPWASSSTISMAYGTSYKGPWGIERLLEDDYGNWPKPSTCFGDFYCGLYEVRDTIVCLSYKDERPYEPIISTYMGTRRVWIKWSHRDRSFGCEVVLFGLKNHAY
jgi:hypothetical protein